MFADYAVEEPAELELLERREDVVGLDGAFSVADCAIVRAGVVFPRQHLIMAEPVERGKEQAGKGDEREGRGKERAHTSWRCNSRTRSRSCSKPAPRPCGCWCCLGGRPWLVAGW